MIRRQWYSRSEHGDGDHASLSCDSSSAVPEMHREQLGQSRYCGKLCCPLPHCTRTRPWIAATESSARWPAAPQCVHFVDIISRVSTPREVSLWMRAELSPPLRHSGLCHVRHAYGAWQGAPPLQGPFWRASANPASLMSPTSAPPFPGFLAESTN